MFISFLLCHKSVSRHEALTKLEWVQKLTAPLHLSLFLQLKCWYKLQSAPGSPHCPFLVEESNLFLSFLASSTNGRWCKPRFYQFHPDTFSVSEFEVCKRLPSLWAQSWGLVTYHHFNPRDLHWAGYSWGCSNQPHAERNVCPSSTDTT